MSRVATPRHPLPEHLVPLSATARLALFLGNLTLEDVPAPVVQEAKRLLVDTLACLGGGARSELGPLSRALAATLGGPGPCFVAGGPDLGPLGAAYANARMANALDFDETFPVGVHFGVGAVAAALALTETRGTSGPDLLAAIVAGYELGGRVATQIGPMMAVEDGRVTGFAPIWGVAAPVVMAAAGAAARVLGADGAAFEQALGLAGANAPVPAGAHWAAAVDLPNAKYCDAGWCAAAGVFGALAAQAGSTGFPGILEGPSSLACMSGVADPADAWLTAGLGERWMLADITYKPWPTCRFTHQALTALDAILAEGSPDLDAIEAIVVETGPLAASRRFTNPSPRTFASRGFSYPLMIALRLLDVPPGPRWYDPALDADPRVERLKGLVRFEPHPRGDGFAGAMVRGQIRAMPAGIRLHLRDGCVRRAQADLARGDPWSEATRLTDDDLAAKLDAAVPGGRALAAAVMRLEEPGAAPCLWRALREAMNGEAASCAVR